MGWKKFRELAIGSQSGASITATGLCTAADVTDHSTMAWLGQARDVWEQIDELAGQRAGRRCAPHCRFVKMVYRLVLWYTIWSGFREGRSVRQARRFVALNRHAPVYRLITKGASSAL